MNSKDVVLARVYRNDKLEGVFPRTIETEATLDGVLASADGDWNISESLKLIPVTCKLPDVFIRMQKGDFSEDVIQAGQDLLEAGQIRTAEKIYNPTTGQGVWHPQLHAIDAMNALFKRPNIMFVIKGDSSAGAIITGYYDKVPLLTEDWTKADFDKRGVRFIPGSFTRAGAYIGSGTTLMPGSIVNSGAYIAGGGVMIDGGARVATGAQIGKAVKLGAGSGVEGILEPRGNLPTVIEDNVRVGANCELCGIIEEGAAIASGVVMTKQKKIYDLRTGKFQDPRVIEVAGERIGVPYIPAGRMAVPGVYMRPGTEIGLACTVLLEKPATESNFMDLPKNADLYVSVKKA